MKQVYLLFFFAWIISCSSEESKPKNFAEKEVIEKYLSDNSISFSTTQGVYRYELIGNPTGNNSGNVYSIYYTLTDLLTGTIIDSYQMADGNPLKLRQGASAVFPQGLDYGLSGIKEGETYGLILPGNLAYGNYPAASVPKDAILHFEVQVVSRQTETDVALAEDLSINNYITTNNLNNTLLQPLDPVIMLSGGVYYKRKVAGNGNQPFTGDSLTLDYNGVLLDNTTFDTNTGFKYKFGSGAVIEGFDIGITEMEQFEVASIFIPSSMGYGASVRVIPRSASIDLIDQYVIPEYSAKVAPYEVLIFHVTLQKVP